MTTKTDNIELPPRPRPATGNPLSVVASYGWSEMQSYARTAATPYRDALRDLIADLELRSNLKTGDDKGLVDCGQGVYERAKRVLGEWDE